jgi:hypothetical protein
LPQEVNSASGGRASTGCWKAASDDYTGDVFVTGSVDEIPHGSHWKTFKFSAKARLIVNCKVIGRLQAGQVTSFVGVTSSLMVHVWMQRQVPAMTDINCALYEPRLATQHQAEFGS